MNKKLSFGLALFLGISGNVIAQGNATQLGLEQSGEYNTGHLGQLQQPLPSTLEEGAVYSVDPYPLYTPELPFGKNRNLVLGHCNICHASTYINMQPPLLADQWETTVQKMIDKFGAPISDDEKDKIVKYLQTYFTPETIGAKENKRK